MSGVTYLFHVAVLREVMLVAVLISQSWSRLGLAQLWGGPGLWAGWMGGVTEVRLSSEVDRHGLRVWAGGSGVLEGRVAREVFLNGGLGVGEEAPWEILLCAYCVCGGR